MRFGIFFEKLAWDTYAFEEARKNFGYPTHGEYDFYANPYHPDHFMNLHDLSNSSVPPILCNIVSLPIMMFILAHIVIMLMLYLCTHGKDNY